MVREPMEMPDVAITGRPPWRIRIEHTTTYRYSDPVRASFNEVRVVPQTNRLQLLLESRVDIVPRASLYRYRDYFGTEVLAFDVPGPHDLLRIRSSALVETRSTGDRPVISWDELYHVRDEHYEYCVPSTYTSWDEELGVAAMLLRRPSPADTVDSVAEWVHDSLEYVSGVTGVKTSALEAWRAGKGVCQDFSHLAITILRLLGIPARYVSGYLHHEGAGVGVESVGESHSWVEAWTGGWWGIDPTNALPAGQRHVVVAQGRDYSDVPPVKGIYAGAAVDEMSVEVSLTHVS